MSKNLKGGWYHSIHSKFC